MNPQELDSETKPSHGGGTAQSDFYTNDPDEAQGKGLLLLCHRLQSHVQILSLKERAAVQE